MPHVGKLYPVSPARDWSKIDTDFRQLMPLGMMVTFSGGTGSECSWLNGLTFPSRRFQYLYDNVFSLYIFDLPTHAGLSWSFTAQWALTHDEDFALWSLALGNSVGPVVFDSSHLHASTSVSNEARWTLPSRPTFGHGGAGFGTGTVCRPMTWSEAHTYLNLPADLRFP